MGQPQLKGLSIEQYLELEIANQAKYEYHKGEVFAMAGASDKHLRLQANLSRAITRGLIENDRQCIVYPSDTKIEIKPGLTYVYPDLSVFCEKPTRLSDTAGAFNNPVLIVEVISKSTANYDRSEKFRLYRSLPSLLEYLIIEQDQLSVTLHRRYAQGDIFKIFEYRELNERIELASVDVTVSMGELYEGVEEITKK
ncbi:hypothetical protein CEQ90_04570 [Lewinellaceae bacterium SD302]|nr:hypothetical protein CEQ90_04570 [Lewinellaceae bacterium SD302]